MALAIDAARASCTVGEISDALERPWGRYALHSYTPTLPTLPSDPTRNALLSPPDTFVLQLHAVLLGRRWCVPGGVWQHHRSG